MTKKTEFVYKLDGTFKKKLRDAFFIGKYYDDDFIRDPSMTPSEYFEKWYEDRIK